MPKREILTPEQVESIAVRMAAIYHGDPALVATLRGLIDHHGIKAVSRAWRQLQRERSNLRWKRREAN